MNFMRAVSNMFTLKFCNQIVYSSVLIICSTRFIYFISSLCNFKNNNDENNIKLKSIGHLVKFFGCLILIYMSIIDLYVFEYLISLSYVDVLLKYIKNTNRLNEIISSICNNDKIFMFNIYAIIIIGLILFEKSTNFTTNFEYVLNLYKYRLFIIICPLLNYIYIVFCLSILLNLYSLIKDGDTFINNIDMFVLKYFVAELITSCVINMQLINGYLIK